MIEKTFIWVNVGDAGGGIKFVEYLSPNNNGVPDEQAMDGFEAWHAAGWVVDDVRAGSGGDDIVILTREKPA